MTYKGEDISNIFIESGQDPGSRAQVMWRGNFNVYLFEFDSRPDIPCFFFLTFLEKLQLPRCHDQGQL